MSYLPKDLYKIQDFDQTVDAGSPIVYQPKKNSAGRIVVPQGDNYETLYGKSHLIRVPLADPDGSIFDIS